MRRSWPTYILIAGLAALLGTLGVLQYRGLRQISESEGDKARRYVREQTERFAIDFNREIQNGYFNFQTGAEVFKNKNWTAFAERYDFWKANTSYPGLISDLYFLHAKESGPVLKYNTESRSFGAADPTAYTDALAARVADETNFQPADVSTFTLLLPIHEVEQTRARMIMRSPVPEHLPPPEMPPRYGYLAIKLDPAVVKDGILADLNKKYFSEGDYRIAVTDTAGNDVYQQLTAGKPDATAQLFDLSPTNFTFFANRDLMKSIAGEKQPRTIPDKHIEEHMADTGGEPMSEANSVVKVEIKREARPRTSIFTATAKADGQPRGPWMLGVQHTSGSLDAYIASTLRRNLIVGYGILFLLAAAVAAIIISSMRVRRFAQRQLDFVSSVSHEFRTPLAVIYSAGENLADGVAKEDSQVSKYGDLIKGEGRKLTAMVEQILDFAGARSGKRKFSFAATNIADVVDAAITECRPMLDERGVEVETAVAEGLPSINGDHAALSQALQNLIANSIKYSNGNPWMRVTASNGVGNIKISVEDRGIGISKSDLRQIFEPFYRSKQVVDAQIHGNGLGLSLVKQIITAHGGTVSAESEIGKGSRFTIELPQGS